MFRHELMRPLAVLSLLAGWAAADDPRTLRYELKATSNVTIQHPAGPQKVQTEYTLRYAWRVQAREQVLVLDSLAERRLVDGRVVSESLTSRDFVQTVTGGQTTRVEFRDAAPPLRQVLTETYGTPLIQRTFDDTGAVQEKVVAREGANPVLQQGYVAPALLLQAPWPEEDQKEWSARSELGFGQIGMATGSLTYKPVETTGAADPRRRVAVSGTLTNAEGKIDPQAGQRYFGVQYKVSGEQVYSSKESRWDSARIEVAASYRMTRDDKSISPATGTIVLEMKSLR